MPVRATGAEEEDVDGLNEEGQAKNHDEYARVSASHCRNVGAPFVMYMLAKVAKPAVQVDVAFI